MRFKRLFISIVLSAVILTGCGSKDADSNNKTNSTPAGTEETQTTITPEGDETPNPEDDKEDEDAPKLLYENNAFGIEGLYQVNISEISDNAIVTRIVEYGDNLLLALYEETETSANRWLALVNPETLQVLKTFDLGDSYFESEYSDVGAEGLIYIDPYDNFIYELDQSLEIKNQYEFKGIGCREYFFNKDWTKMYYTAGEKIYCYDIEAGTDTVIGEDYPVEAGQYSTIRSYYKEENYLVLERNVGENTEVWCLDIDNNEFIDYEYKLIKKAKQSDKLTYGFVENDGIPFPIIISCENNESMVIGSYESLSMFSYLKFDCNSKYLFSMNVFETKDEFYKNIGIYSTETGKKEYSFSLNLPADVAGVSNEAVYLDKLGLIILNGSKNKNGLLAYKLDQAEKVDEPAMVYTYEDVLNSADENLAALREKAAGLDEKYGIEIYIGQDITKMSVPNYLADTLTNIALIDMTLNMLDKVLSEYPIEMVKNLSDDYGGTMKFYISGSLYPAGEIGILPVRPAGFHNNQIGDRLICVDPARLNNTGLYGTINHELYHAFDSHGFNCSIGVNGDEWISHNPEGFIYNFYRVDGLNDSTKYTLEDEEGNVHFIDSYALQNVGEDQARIFEYAMYAKDNYNVFEGQEILQEKVKLVSKRIRSVYSNVTMDEVMPWDECIQ